MNFTLRPSLEHFSAVRIAIELWNSRDIKKELTNLVFTWKPALNREFYERIARETKLVDMILAKVDRLPIHRNGKQDTQHIMKFMGLEMCINYGKLFSLERVEVNFDLYLDHLHWTSWGTIDKRKTLQSLIELGAVNGLRVQQPYTWVLKNCRGEFEASDRQHLSDNSLVVPINGEHLYLDTWYHHVSLMRPTKYQRLMGFNRFECLTNRVINNEEEEEISFENFWFKSSEQERIAIVETVSNFKLSEEVICCSELLFFLMTRMNYGQQVKFLRRNSLVILKLLLDDWLRQNLFLKTVKLLEKVGTESHFCKLLSYVTIKGNRFAIYTEDSRLLFEKLWSAIPQQCKDSIFNQPMDLLTSLFVSQDFQSVQLMITRVSLSTVVAAAFKFLRWIENPTYFVLEKRHLLEQMFVALKLNINHFKFLLVVENDFFACRKLICENKWDQLDEFLNWGSYSEKEMYKLLKKMLLEMDLFDFTFCDWWIINNERGVINKLANWCGFTKREKIAFKWETVKRGVRLFHLGKIKIGSLIKYCFWTLVLW